MGECIVIVGGQFGAEGKGKVVALEAASVPNPWVVRCGGPNSGHTVSINGQRIGLRQVPAAAGHPTATLLLAAGCAVDPEILIREADQLAVPRDRLLIDPRAVLVEDSDRRREGTLQEHIGSTGSGTGAALQRRMAREPTVRLAGASNELMNRARVEPVAPRIHQHLEHGGTLIVEGTQGFGLSLFHGPDYPFVTARDTTAAAFASEVGLSPLHITRVVLVVRTFPIRVGGRSGPLPEEITWEQVAADGDAPTVIPEVTTVTRRLRRVGRFSLDMVLEACRYNAPTELAIMGLDRLDHKNTRAPTFEALSSKATEFVRNTETTTGVPARWLGTGFETQDVILRTP